MNPAAQHPNGEHATHGSTQSFIFINLAAVAAVARKDQMGQERVGVEDGGYVAAFGKRFARIYTCSLLCFCV